MQIYISKLVLLASLVWAPTRFRNDIRIKLGRNYGAVLHYACKRAYRVDFFLEEIESYNYDMFHLHDSI